MPEYTVNVHLWNHFEKEEEIMNYIPQKALTI